MKAIIILVVLLGILGFGFSKTYFHEPTVYSKNWSENTTIVDSTDTLLYDLKAMDSLYSDINIQKFRIKTAFPYIWSGDLDANGTVEFSEFQGISSTYLDEDTFRIAINYETAYQSNDIIYLNLIDQQNGKIIYVDSSFISWNNAVNKLAYFIIPPFKSNNLNAGDYQYQIKIINQESDSVRAGYANRLTIKSKPLFVPPLIKDTVKQEVFFSTKDVRLNKKIELDSVKVFKDSLSIPYRKAKRAIRKSYRAKRKMYKKEKRKKK